MITGLLVTYRYFKNKGFYIESLYWHSRHTMRPTMMCSHKISFVGSSDEYPIVLDKLLLFKRKY